MGAWMQDAGCRVCLCVGGPAWVGVCVGGLCARPQGQAEQALSPGLWALGTPPFRWGQLKPLNPKPQTLNSNLARRDGDEGRDRDRDRDRSRWVAGALLCFGFGIWGQEV